MILLDQSIMLLLSYDFATHFIAAPFLYSEQLGIFFLLQLKGSCLENVSLIVNSIIVGKVVLSMVQ